MKLNELRDIDGATHARKRVGRGIGSGLGKTSGRGMKGQKSRSGVAIKGFEGGQMPIHRRLPKRGFVNYTRKHFNAVNLGRIQAAIDAKKLDPKKTVDLAVLIEAGIVRRPLDGVRLLAKGELTTKVNFAVNGVSKTALDAVEKAGGKVEIVASRPTAASTKDEEKAEKPKKAKKAKKED